MLRRRPLVLVAVLAAAPVAGCVQQPKPQPQKTATPFVFQALNLRQQDAQGRLQWLVTSPEARYDLGRRLSLARDLKGEIHSNGKVLYRLQANHGTVLSDGEVIQLEGSVSIERLGNDPVMIQASRMRWYPRQQRIELDRRASAVDQDLRLTAERATLLLDQDLLQLRGKPTLQARGRAGGADLQQLDLQAVDWSPGGGRLIAPGQVLARSLVNGRAIRALRASGLEGNTVARTITLLAPVRLEAPPQKARLDARSSTLDLARNAVSSAAPFTASIDQIAVAGDGLRLNLDANTATITSGCRLSQPGLVLTANLCRWNWRNNAVAALGSVVLRRAANQQTTRASQLQGTIGANGRLQFSAPGSRVRSTLVLPRSQEPKGFRL